MKKMLCWMVLWAWVGGCSSEDEGNSACGPTSGQVVAVTDGDTLKVKADGGEEIEVRLLLVDTPETTKGKNECYGDEAKQFLFNKLRYQHVTLSYEGESDCTDQFGRYLAYVSLEGESVTLNERLIEDGYARVCRIGCDEGRFLEFEELEDEAKASEIGLWNPEICPGFAEDLTSWGASGCVRCR